MTFQAGLQEAMGKHRKPYHTVARQVQAFKCGSVSTADMNGNGHCCMSVDVSEKCMDKDRCSTMKKTAEHTWISWCTVLQILGQVLKMCKISAKRGQCTL